MTGYARVQRENLEGAANALAAGNTDSCRSWALKALYRARNQDDCAGKADAYLLLSRAEFIDSRVSNSHGWSALALKSAEAMHDPYRAAESLGMQSCTATWLGWTELAANSGKASLRLRGHHTDCQALAHSYNYLAVASAWSGDIANADGLFTESAEFAGESSSPDQRFQPLVNQCLSQMLDIQADLHERRSAGLNDVNLDLLHRRFHHCRQMLLAGQTGVLNEGMQDLVTLLLVTLGCQISLLIGEQHESDLYLQECRSRANRLPTKHWARALYWWAELECARASSDHRRERFSRNAMKLSAKKGEHRPLYLLAQLGEDDEKPISFSTYGPQFLSL